VWLGSESRREGFDRFALTGAEGKFAFAELSPGSYTLLFAKSGYQRRTLRVAHKKADGTELLVKLRQAAAISGRVLDGDGEPVPAAEVRAYQTQSGSGRTSLVPRARARTDDRGAYRLYELPAGNYLIRAAEAQPESLSEKGELTAAAVFYPNVMSAEQAVPLRVGSGQELEGIDLRFSNRPAHGLAGIIVDESNEEAWVDCEMAVIREDHGWSEVVSEINSLPATGRFAIHGLSPGNYRIAACRRDGDATCGIRPVQITDHDLQDITVLIGAGVAISGRIVWDDPPPARRGRPGYPWPSSRFISRAIGLPPKVLRRRTWLSRSRMCRRASIASVWPLYLPEAT
jgi:hypothetical protein